MPPSAEPAVGAGVGVGPPGGGGAAAVGVEGSGVVVVLRSGGPARASGLAPSKILESLPTRPPVIATPPATWTLDGDAALVAAALGEAASCGAPRADVLAASSTRVVDTSAATPASSPETATIPLPPVGVGMLLVAVGTLPVRGGGSASALDAEGAPAVGAAAAPDARASSRACSRAASRAVSSALLVCICACKFA